MSEVKAVFEFLGDGRVNVLPEFQEDMTMLFDGCEPGQKFEVTYKPITEKSARTKAEQAAIEVYCRKVAKVCNEGGITIRELVTRFKESAELPCSQAGIKEGLFRQMMWHCFNVESTTELKPTEPHHVWLWCDSFTQQHFNFSVPWPRKEDKDDNAKP